MCNSDEEMERVLHNQFRALVPSFKINRVGIITKVPVFYNTLKYNILNAKKRIFISSLYIGKHENDLIETIRYALKKNPDLKVDILLDCLRSTRDFPNYSTASLLTPLLKDFQHRIDVRLYHTPHLNGWMAKIIPQRINEIFGLQHMKIYGTDNRIIMTGANLSEDYFTDRQDRYWVVEDKPLADYYHRLQTTIGKLSYKLFPKNGVVKEGQEWRLDWPTSNLASEFRWNIKRYLLDAKRELSKVVNSKPDNDYAPECQNIQMPASSDIVKLRDVNDTIVYPISSFYPLCTESLHTDPNVKDTSGLSTELSIMTRLLSLLSHPSTYFTMTAGYFNIHPLLADRVASARCNGEIIVAAPEANSFYKSKGISSYIPQAYIVQTSEFMEDLLITEGKLPRRGIWSNLRLWVDNMAKMAQKGKQTLGDAMYAPTLSTDVEDNYKNQNESYKDKMPSGFSRKAPGYDDLVLASNNKKIEINPEHELRPRVKILEWQNGVVNTPDGYTYHAKGVWLTLPSADHSSPDVRSSITEIESNFPSITVIGSSQYTKRAYTRDLETNILVFTKDSGLRSDMQKEIENLKQYTTEMKLGDFKTKGKREVKWWERVFGKFLSNFM
ncbi:CDP-diacylglycerol--glycerol-3-phosphate 3-phosphatidyltransferase [Martiniozyma asiatica (nom. inval.)]|nr:CDP-diacylglycerol--glycerol-3-phosphate 3-phosphatidyltransferase [Martiniozyma asiatica]